MHQPPTLPPHPFDIELPRLDAAEIPATLFRIHWPNCVFPQHMAKPGFANGYRFDDANRVSKVLYAGEDLETCVFETLIRNNLTHLPQDQRFIPLSSIVRGKDRSALPRQVSMLKVIRPPKVAKLSGPMLALYGITHICTWDDYEASQAWSSAIHLHPDAYDGIAFRSRYNNDMRSYAIYERAWDQTSSNKVIQVVETFELQSYAPFFSILTQRGIDVI